MVRLLVEAVAVGLILVVVGTLVSWVVGRMMGTDLPPVCKDWNKNYVMEICLFLSGVIVHLLCEFSGLNKWYCKNGFACRR
tara:strand:- start:11 stop:253 length:243 start_codon:yes stop_codon:yes gene_type:complete